MSNSTRSRKGSARARSVRQAKDRTSQRRQALLRQVRDIESAVATILEENDKAISVRQAAKARADKIVETGEKRAAAYESVAATAVLELVRLGETRRSIAELTQLNPHQIRQLLTHAETPTDHTPTSAETATEPARNGGKPEE